MPDRFRPPDDGFARPGGDPAQHPLEDEPVRGGHGAPVQNSPQALRDEAGPLLEFPRPGTGPPYPEGQHGAPGKGHLRDEHEIFPRRHRAYSPEIHRVPRLKIRPVLPPPPHSDPAHQAVEESPAAPEPAPLLPPPPPADPGDRFPCLLRGRLENHPAVVVERRASPPWRVSREGAFRRPCLRFRLSLPAGSL